MTAVPSSSPGTPLSALLVHARQRPQTVAARFLQADGTLCDLSWGELWWGARSAADLLRETAAPGAVAAILLPTGPAFVQALYGCFLAGAIALPGPPLAPGHDARPAAILAATRPEVAFTSAGLVRLRRPELPPLSWTPPLGQDAFSATCDPTGQTLPEDDAPAYLQTSSGSTSAPRAVVITHRQAAANVAGILRAFGIGPADSLVTWLPLYHDMGLVGGVLAPLTAGDSTVLMPPTAFGRDPLSWLRAVARFGATVSGAPDFAYRLCAERAAQAAAEGLDLSRWELAFVGAETVRPSTLRRFARAFAPLGFRASALYPCYGLAEAVLMVSGGRRGAGWRAAEVPGHAAGVPAREVTGCGEPLDGVEVLIADPVTRSPLPDDCEGEVLVQGPSVGAGYWNPNTRTPQAFTVGVAGRPGSGFLPTGDLGFLRGGELFLTGRQAGRLVVRGRNLAAEALEAAAETAHPALRGHVGVVLAVETADADRLVLVQEAPRRLRREPSVLRSVCRAVRQALAERWGVCPDDVLLVPRGAVPRTTSGKPIRAACRTAYLAGKLERLRLLAGPVNREPHAAGDIPDTPEERLLAELWERQLNVDDVRRSDRFAALGGDSLAAVMVVGEAARWGLVLDPGDLLRGATLADMAAGGSGRRSWAVPELGAGQGVESGADQVPARAARAARGSHAGSDRLALAPNQREFFDRCPAAAEDAWRITAVLDTPPGLDPGLLREAWAILVARHQALRLYFPLGADGRREARIAAQPLAPLELAASAAPPTAGFARVPGAMDHLDGICLATGPVAAARLHPACGTAPGRLVVSVHHLACDASSLHILGRDLAALCADLAAGGRGELSGRSASYAEWALARDRFRESPELAGELAFWKQQFREVGEHPRSTAGDLARDAITIGLDRPATWALFHRSPTVYGVGAETLLVAALAASCGTGDTAASVYLCRHGRQDTVSGLDLSATVGWLAYRHPLRIERPCLADPWLAAARTGAAQDQVPREGAGYGLLLDLPGRPELTRLAAISGCDAQLNFIGNRDLDTAVMDGWRVSAWGLERCRAMESEGHVQVRAVVRGGRLHLHWQSGAKEVQDGPRAMLAALQTFLAPLMI